ncbi:sensor histidine kinase [Mariniblastus fucicola]|uniref:histidine kinase n=1 Tax=Mariniblastus fucicola TaxID=980251 RepID=A0A5B9P5B1_9BACT|nr:HAMP domain-containing sensor histidine kinase [Mariniblastus fucicola]QEG21454.1 Alkaline phosphatase synthesis sensor protein PhoR [Mariniblastus fucicola]
MFERKSLKLPITLGVTMIVVTVALLIGWVLLNIFWAFSSNEPGVYWVLLSVGSVLFVGVLVGVAIYLTVSIKAVNLTQRQSNFIDSVTHELKSPIASLKLYLQTLNMREVSKEERKKFLEFMMDDVERLDALINHVLDAGYTGQSNQAPVMEPIDLENLLKQCVRLVSARYRIPEDAITLETDPCEIRGERIDLVMIFRNLIDNAVKYAGSPPVVRIKLLVTNNFAVVRIADNGPGIPQDLRSRVFARFVRIGDELQREKPGTGLGLHIVKTLLKRARGKIKISDNSQEDSGTVFEVKLPGAYRPASKHSQTKKSQTATA